MYLIIAQEIFLFLSIFQVTTQTEAHFKDSVTDICQTSGCNETARMILENMDRTVKPCNDFYQFACGNFQNKSRRESFFNATVVNVLDQVMVMLAEQSKPDDSKYFKLVKSIYKACGSRPSEIMPQQLKKILESFGGWPAIMGDEWNETSFNWTKSIYRFRKMGLSIHYFIDFKIKNDLKNSTRKIIHLDQPSLSRPREILIQGIENDDVKKYYTNMINVAQFLGANENQMEELRISLNFEFELANITIPDKERQKNLDSLHNLMTVKQLQRDFPSIPWLEYINNLLGSNSSIAEDEVVNVVAPSYIRKLEELLKKTPKRVQANYMMWRVADSILNLLKSAPKQEDKLKECMMMLSSHFPAVMESHYVRKYLNRDIKKTAADMAFNIKEQFEKILEKITWMDDETKRTALDKAKSVTMNIAYPDEYLNDKKLEELYQKLVVEPDNHLQSMLNLSLFKTETMMDELKKPVNKSHWADWTKMDFHSFIHNTIHLPPGFLQGIYFSLDRPMYLNYAIIGSAIGNLLEMGLGSYGRWADKNGNFNDWWSKDTVKNHENWFKCMADQYENDTTEDKHWTSTVLDLTESNGGIKAAYHAYNEWAQRNQFDLARLPGLQEYSPQQMFWISSVNEKCGTLEAFSYENNVALSNMAEFSRDFECPVGSRMNTEIKCPLW